MGANALRVGEWREGTDIRTRVSKFVQAADAADAGLPSYLVGDPTAEGALADVQMCVRKTSSQPLKADIWDLFYVYDKAGGQYSRAGTSWDAWPPRPQLPWQVNLPAGRCITGWLLFSVPRDTHIKSIDLESSGETTAQWLAP